MLPRLFKALIFLRKKIIRLEKHDVFFAKATAADTVVWPASEIPLLVTAGAEIEHRIKEGLIGFSPENIEFIEALSKGEMDGLFIFSKGILVHYSFLMWGNKTARLMGFDKNTALIGNMYSRPDYRGNGCQGRAAAKLIERANKLGIKNVVAETSYSNKASQHGLQKGGMISFGKIELLILLNFFVIRYRRPSNSIPLFDFVF